MRIDDELNGYLDDDGNVPTPRQRQASVLVRDFQNLGLELADALHARGVPPQPFTAKSSEPANKITHFFKGPMSNPMIRVAHGWRIRTHLGLDVDGYWWQWGYVPVVLGGYEKSAQGYYGYERLDMSRWIDRLSQAGFIRVGSVLKIGTAQNEHGRAFLYCEYREGMSLNKLELRHYLLQGAADLINGQRST